jgi:hypothetical protein
MYERSAVLKITPHPMEDHYRALEAHPWTTEAHPWTTEAHSLTMVAHSGSIGKFWNYGMPFLGLCRLILGLTREVHSGTMELLRLIQGLWRLILS